MADATHQELINAQEKLAGAQLEISSMRGELAEYHKLSKYAVDSGELIRDKQYHFTSLCRVSIDYDGRTKLKRLSDVLDGIIIGDNLEDAPRRDWLYMRDGPTSENFIGLWDWSGSF